MGLRQAKSPQTCILRLQAAGSDDSDKAPCCKNRIPAQSLCRGLRDGVRIIRPSSRQHIRELLVVDDLSEVFLQRSAADQAAVDVGLCEELGSGCAVDRAAVLDADLLSCVS